MPSRTTIWESSSSSARLRALSCPLPRRWGGKCFWIPCVRLPRRITIEEGVGGYEVVACGYFATVQLVVETTTVRQGSTEEELERETGVEPATSTLARSRSTTELLPLDGSFYTRWDSGGQRGSVRSQRSSRVPTAWISSDTLSHGSRTVSVPCRVRKGWSSRPFPGQA